MPKVMLIHKGKYSFGYDELSEVEIATIINSAIKESNTENVILDITDEELQLLKEMQNKLTSYASPSVYKQFPPLYIIEFVENTNKGIFEHIKKFKEVKQQEDEKHKALTEKQNRDKAKNKAKFALNKYVKEKTKMATELGITFEELCKEYDEINKTYNMLLINYNAHNIK